MLGAVVLGPGRVDVLRAARERLRGKKVEAAVVRVALGAPYPATGLNAQLDQEWHQALFPLFRGRGRVMPSRPLLRVRGRDAVRRLPGVLLAIMVHFLLEMRVAGVHPFRAPFR